MGLLGRVLGIKDRLTAQRFEYEVTIANVTPWPESNRPICVAWQRGKRKGSTKSVFLAPQSGRLGCIARINEKFTFTSTLYKASSGQLNRNKLGPFKKKCLILAILETNGKNHATGLLGRVVIDLAELAAVDKVDVRYYAATCQPQIHTAVGEPEILVSIRTRLKAASAGAPKDHDDSVSVSTDTTGSRLSESLSTFFRNKVPGRRNDESDGEQDLAGFNAGRVSSRSLRQSADRPVGVQDKTERAKSMNVITECHEGEEGHDGVPSKVHGAAVLRRTRTTPPRPSHHGEVDIRGSGEGKASPGGSTNDVMRGSVLSSPGDSKAHASAPIHTLSDEMTTEIQEAAAIEVGVLLARSAAAQSKQGERAAHAAARRLVRTMVSLGATRAPLFGQYALDLIYTQLDSGYADLGGLAFWWSNLAHMRALLQQCKASGQLPSTTCEPLEAQIAAAEKSAFTQVVNFLWDGFLLPVGTDAAGIPSAKAGSSSGSTARKVQQDAASRKWLDGLRLVYARLAALQAYGSGSRRNPGLVGHTGVLRQLALVQCIRRLDALLFYYLVKTDAAPEDFMHDYDSTNTLWGAPGAAAPHVDEMCLPFTPGQLSFGAGMNVKMTLTRFQQWANTEAGFADPSTSTSLFPLLRAATDLLMMPKDLLSEESIRQDVGQALSIRTLRHMMETFEPDEYAMDAIEPEVIEAIREAEKAGNQPAPELTDMSNGYKPPNNDLLLVRVSQGVEPSVEYDADSEDELVGFSSMAAPTGGGARFKMLHGLWCSRDMIAGANSVRQGGPASSGTATPRLSTRTSH